MTQKVGLIGLGSIGHPLAVNMIAKGLEVHGYRRSPMTEFEAAGGKPAASPKAIAETCDIIAMVLPGEHETEEVLFGPQGILAAGRKELIIIDLSTYPLGDKQAFAARVQEAGSFMMDCPLSGVPSMVAARNGIIFASGEKEAFEKSRHVFEAMSDKCFYLGKFGDGLKMKFVANTLVSIHILAAAEALALGVAAGLDRDTMVKVLSPSAGTSLQFQVRAPLMMKKQYEPVMAPTSILSKDVPVFIDFAKSMGAKTPLLEVAERFYTRALGTPWESKDVASIIELYAQDNGITI